MRLDLARYAKDASAQHRLSADEARILLDELKKNVTDQAVRFFEPPSGNILSGAGAPPPRSADSWNSERPYSHPYYWGGFFITGL